MSKDVRPAIDLTMLPQDVAVCHALIAQLLEELRKRDGRVEDLEHRMDLLLRRLYGRSSEKIDPAQLLLFEAAPEEPAPSPPPVPAKPAASTKTAGRPGHGRRRLPDTLRRVEITHDLTPAEKELLGGEANLTLIGREITEQLEWEPSSLYVIRHVQLTYARRDASASGARTGNGAPADGVLDSPQVVTASKPPQPIPGGLPGPGLLAHVATSKYVDHVPLHRQERQFARHGVTLARQTTCDWAMAGADLLAPLWRLAHRIVLESDIVHLDATRAPIRDARRRQNRTGHFWPLVGDDLHPLIAFQYTPSHAREGPREFLNGYRGYLQVDAHSVYDELFAGGKVVEVGCWMHARRKFFEARGVDRPRAETALAHIGRLYAIEKEIQEHTESTWRELPREERIARVAQTRRERARPILDELFAWFEADAPNLVPKNPVRRAMDYALRQRACLTRYCEDGRLSIDNGAAERAIRSIALGRRNWLFCGSERGARAACVYFTLAATCRRHDLDPFAYLRDLFARLPIVQASNNSPLSDEQLRPLLPDRWQSAP